MVGVGVGMLIFGILLGALLLHFINLKRQTKEQPQYEMSIKNKNYNEVDKSQKSERDS